MNSELRTYLEGSIQGDVIYATTTTPMRLGGLKNPKFQKAYIDTPLPEGKDIHKALLEVAITSPQNPYGLRWKLWFNGFTVTRELKPHLVVNTKEQYFAKVVFDVTPITKSQSKHTVSVFYEGGEPITIDHVGLLILYPTDEVKSSLSYLSGAGLLQPGEELKIEVKLERIYGTGTFILTSIMPSPMAKLCIKVNEENIGSLSGITGVEEYIKGNINLLDVNNVTLMHEKTGTKYYPSEIKISSIILCETICKLPKIVVKNIELHEDEGLLKLKIANEGSSKPDKVLILLIDRGNILGREIIREIKPGSVIDVEVKLRKRIASQTPTLRIVWNKLSRMKVIDQKLNFRTRTNTFHRT